jgi:hypothetical protein
MVAESEELALQILSRKGREGLMQGLRLLVSLLLAVRMLEHKRGAEG